MESARRVRRGNVEDHELLRQQVLEAAFDLNAQGGMDALSMRAIAQRVGLSAMTLYRYFNGKAEIINAMWCLILMESSVVVQAAVARCRTPRSRLRASIEAAIDYWDGHPERFELVFVTPEMVQGPMRSALTESQAYRELVTFSQRVVEEFVLDVGGDPRAVALARDLRLSMVIGYLHSKAYNRRHPWTDLPALREYTVEAIIRAIESCAVSYEGAPPATRAA
jgi:AcrR family transcriptional regulator